MIVNWKGAQAKLGVVADGVPGRITYAAMFRFMGCHDAAIAASLGNAAAVHFPKYGAADSLARLADFIAQTANESGGYTVFEENLHYSARRLMQVWPSRFPTLAAAQPYSWDPSDPDREDIALADYIYGKRMGNEANGTDDDDGWEFRGRGLLELTGKGNYDATDRRLGIGLDRDPDLAAVPALSLLIALDFYTANGIWAVLDAGQPTRARQITNGGTIGLDNVNLLRKKVTGLF